MGYDEHFSGSEESGSVASIDFVREGIEATIQQVPAEKVINAVPFYTRLWKEAPQAEGGLAAEALGMAEAMQRVTDAGVGSRMERESDAGLRTMGKRRCNL